MENGNVKACSELSKTSLSMSNSFDGKANDISQRAATMEPEWKISIEHRVTVDGEKSIIQTAIEIRAAVNVLLHKSNRGPAR